MKTLHVRRLLLGSALLIASAMYAQTKTDHSLNHTLMNSSPQENNKDIVRSLYEDVINRRNYALLSRIVSEHYTGIRGLKGATAMQESLQPLIAAFPDIQYHIEELLAEGTKVTIRWKWQGTHQAAFLQYAATGKVVGNEGMAIYELKDNRITAVHMQIDRLGFLQALGVLPQELGASAVGSLLAKQVRFIDKFVVPAAARQEFMERVKKNRQFISQLDGFVHDAAYESKDEKGNILLLTIAVWRDEEALKKAKQAVQAEYKSEGFNPAQLMERLEISMERGVYGEVKGW